MVNTILIFAHSRVLLHVSSVALPRARLLRAGYFGDESLILQDTVGTLARDAFRYRVSDAAGANSSEASVTVAVRTALVTLPTSAFAPLESHLASPIKKYTVYEETPGAPSSRLALSLRQPNS